MPISTEKLLSGAGENKMNIATLLFMLLVGGGGSLTLATKDYVQEQIQAETSGTKENVELILELQTAERIETILKWRCMNPGNTTMDAQLRELESRYREITGYQYQRPSCNFLLGSS